MVSVSSLVLSLGIFFHVSNVGLSDLRYGRPKMRTAWHPYQFFSGEDDKNRNTQHVKTDYLGIFELDKLHSSITGIT